MKLLSDLQAVLRTIEADLLARSEERPEIREALEDEHRRAAAAERTAQGYEEWRADRITQVAAAWVLSGVFARFLEDNRLVDPPKLSGPGERLARARDEHELYFRAHPTETDREYLWQAFEEWSRLPGCAGVFQVRELELASLRPEPSSSRIEPGRPGDDIDPNRDAQETLGRQDAGPTGGAGILSAEKAFLEKHTEDEGLRPTDEELKTKNQELKTSFWLSGDAAGELLRFVQRIDPESGALVHDFTDPAWDTRFLGDLYQDLSESARKRYALLQTPEFVEAFILDRTLDPAIEEFGLRADASSWVTPHGSSVTGHSLWVIDREKTKDQGPRTNDGFKMIDPACGSGHFLLGSFARLLDRWQRKEPGTNVRILVQRALDGVHGVDVNPYAVAIARFRLLLAALLASGIRRLREAPDFRLNLAVGDSLLHGVESGDQQVFGYHKLSHHYQGEDLAALHRILRPGRYHAVVANPPYITPKDSALGKAYRGRYRTCYRQYSLAVPFMEKIFSLAIPGGFTGQITANSFMKREFGKKLIEEFLPRIDLTHVIDTSGAYIPGHGTPTVILLGRHRQPVSQEVRAVLGIRGEPSTPEEPAQGKVWRSIIDHLDQRGSQNEFVTVTDMPRESFCRHPWSIGGGGAAELKETIERGSERAVGDVINLIGFVCMTRADDVYFATDRDFLRHRIAKAHIVLNVEGDRVRDWTVTDPNATLFPYCPDLKPITESPSSPAIRFLWPHRTHLWLRREPNGNHREIGLTWFEWSRFQRERFRTPLSIAFAFVATHNHFVLDRGGKVFNRSAPIIKLPAEATEEDHLALLGLLNSSTACFWMKQVFHNKGSTVDDRGARQTTIAFENFYEFTGTGLQQFPLASDPPLDLARRLDRLAQDRQRHLPGQLAARFPLSRTALGDHRHQASALLGRMIALQEELDWRCYSLYRIADEDLGYRDAAGNPLQPPAIALGQRAFEIRMARQMAAGEIETTWFERHGSTPSTEIPVEWPEDYRRLVARRIETLQTAPNVGLIEQPEYKRRWNTEPWEARLDRALRDWLLDRLESYFDFDGRMNELPPLAPPSKGGDGRGFAESESQERKRESPPPLADLQLVSIARLADVAARDAAFLEVGALYRDDPAFDVGRLVAELVEAESVPLLPVLRYKPSGLRKRAEWERTWELQRLEDRLLAGEHVDLGAWSLDERQRAAILSWQKAHANVLSANRPERSAKGPALSPPFPIPVPPKYTSADFQNSHYWRLRGKLDVPKERWVRFPHCEGEDGAPVVAWAGYDALQRARAISAYYVYIQERLGGRDDPRLEPLLACLIELLPWLQQWHNHLDPEFGLSMGDYFEGFIQEEARQMGKTPDEVHAWEPTQKTTGRRRKPTT